MGTGPSQQTLLKTFNEIIQGYANSLSSRHLLRRSCLPQLLEGFLISLDRFGNAEAEKAHESLPVLTSLIDGYKEPSDAWKQRQRFSPDDFNLLEAIGVDCKEACHSRLLAWLLDRRIDGYGSHAQCELGFRLFLQELEKRLDPELRCSVVAYADDPLYWVRCEVPGKKSRIDVEIAARGRFVIHIENKIQAPEGESETNREWDDLLERAEELGVNSANAHGIFLTLDGRVPKNSVNNGFRSVSWVRIARVFEEFAEKAKPDIVKLFAIHYAAAVRKLVASKPQIKEIEDVETLVQRTGAVPPDKVDGCGTS